MSRQRSTWSIGMLVICGLSAGVNLQAGAAQWGDAVAPDFAFRFALGVCGGELVVDTFNGTVARTAPPAATIPLVLSDQECTRVRQAIDGMQFFALPSRYVVVPPPEAVLFDTLPAFSHTLRVRRDGQVHEVNWSDRRTSVPPDPVYLKLRDVADHGAGHGQGCCREGDAAGDPALPVRRACTRLNQATAVVRRLHCCLRSVGMAIATALATSVTSLMAALPVIRIESGLVQGIQTGDAIVYRSIPYASPPIGELRWKAPQPPPSWTGVRQTGVFGPVCMQTGVSVPGAAPEPVSEDCLTLNVWTPAAARGRLPVMVWIPGGGFTQESASMPLYWGDVLTRRGVIVVTINYRVGVFGFLAHPDLSRESRFGTSGNYGLLDQIAALEWVKRNIGAFGGDAGRVTIWGQSAGAMAVTMLTTSPLSKGLMHRAIGQSGGFFTPPRGHSSARHLVSSWC